jgi:serine/threonine-protein kinase RsbW
MEAIIEESPGTDTATAVRLVVPRSLEYVPLARVTVAGYAARLGFDVDEIEDSRIAVDELARVLIEVGDGDTIELTLRGADHRFDIEGSTSCAPATVAPQLDPIASQILGAICHEYAVNVDADAVRFRAAIVGAASR